MSLFNTVMDSLVVLTYCAVKTILNRYSYLNFNLCFCPDGVLRTIEDNSHLLQTEIFFKSFALI